ncbi:MAG: glycosyltransferase family 9 protein [bacterium]|nr:glycosyltransferase family 9 protein [bacterium]MDO8742398.1 glycosyltransferase family 9 protein [bacterium]
MNSSLLADSGLVDDYIADVHMRDYVAALRRERIDTVLITGPSLEDVAAALIAGVPQISAPRVTGGYSPQQVRPYVALLRFVREFPFAIDAYAPRERLRALEPFGIIVNDTKKHLGYSESALKVRANFLKKHNLTLGTYAIISPSAGNKIKAWPAERFARVAEHVARKGVPTVVIGGSRDGEEVKAMLGGLKDPSSVIDASEQFSLDELKAFVAGAALFISVDTGPLYIAEAFDVPTVDIVGPVDERVQPPVGPRHAVVVSKRTRPMLSIMNARVYDRTEARRQVESTSAEEVCATIDALCASVVPSSHQ